MYYEPMIDVDKTLTTKEYENSSVQLHYHEAIELIFVFEGKLSVHVGQQEFIVSPNEIVFIPSFFPHSVRPVEQSRSATVMIPKKYFEPAGFANKVYFLLDNKEKNDELFHVYLKLTESIQNNFDKEIVGYSLILFAMIERLYEQSTQRLDKNNLIVDVINYINEHYQDELTLDSLAKHFGYSKYYFSRFFNANFHCNLRSYLGYLRWNETEKSIAEGHSTTEAVFNSGINNLATFYRLKKKHR